MKRLTVFLQGLLLALAMGGGTAPALADGRTPLPSIV